MMPNRYPESYKHQLEFMTFSRMVTKNTMNLPVKTRKYLVRPEELLSKKVEKGSKKYKDMLTGIMDFAFKHAKNIQRTVKHGYRDRQGGGRIYSHNLEKDFLESIWIFYHTDMKDFNGHMVDNMMDFKDDNMSTKPLFAEENIFRREEFVSIFLKNRNKARNIALKLEIWEKMDKVKVP